MVTLRKLTNKKLDELQDRLQEKLCDHAYSWERVKIRKYLLRVGNERARRLGL